jgi:hypothetical protein
MPLRVRLALLLAVAAAVLMPAPKAAVAASGGTDRPIAGNASGTNAISPGTGTFTSDATGLVSHLGRTAFHIEGTFGLTGADVAVSGLMTATSASGDRLTGDFQGSGTTASRTIDIAATFTPNGGTGRFDDASGSVSGTIHERILSVAGGVLTNATEFRFRGDLSY